MEITDTNIQSWLDSIDESRRDDMNTLLLIGEKLTGYKPVLWGSIVGFGKVHYVYDTGREGDMPLFGFANRKAAITLYTGYNIENFEGMDKLGRYKTSKACLYIKKLSDVNLDVLEHVIQQGLDQTRNTRQFTEI